MDETLKTAIRAERIRVYGDPYISHKAIGYGLRAVLQNRWQHLDIPEIDSSLTAELLAVFKVVRAARPANHFDSQEDAHVYLDFDVEFRKRGVDEDSNSSAPSEEGPSRVKPHGKSRKFTR